MAKIDLNAPAFGSGAQTPEEIDEAAVVAPVEAPTEEQVTPSSEESKVPYSRFKKFHDAALEAQKEADYWRERANSQTTSVPQASEIDMPSYWVENYGNNEASQKAWQNQLRLQAEVEERAERRALEAVRNERYAEVQQVEENVEAIDNNFESLSEFVGRELSEKEQLGVLDAVDYLSPKDRYGNYEAVVPYEAAWDYYQAKLGSSKAPKTASRDAVASLTGTGTQGEASVNAEADKNFNPRDWNAWKKRI
jgi:hypothetical protein